MAQTEQMTMVAPMEVGIAARDLDRMKDFMCARSGSRKYRPCTSRRTRSRPARWRPMAQPSCAPRRRTVNASSCCLRHRQTHRNGCTGFWNGRALLSHVHRLGYRGRAPAASRHRRPVHERWTDRKQTGSSGPVFPRPRGEYAGTRRIRRSRQLSAGSGPPRLQPFPARRRRPARPPCREGRGRVSFVRSA